MSRRLLISGFLTLVCLVTLAGLWYQRNQLARLRAEQQQVMAQVATQVEGSSSSGTADAESSRPNTPPPALVVTPELLRLRNEVTRLTERQRELAGARAENERLRAQLASRATNSPAGTPLPPGYMRRTEARLVGFSTPEDTLQSMLWSFQHRDLTNLMQAFAPETAERLRAQASQSPQGVEELFNQSAAFIGLRVVRREQDASDGSIVVEVEVMPGAPSAQVRFRQLNGQWKIAGGF